MSALSHTPLLLTPSLTACAHNPPPWEERPCQALDWESYSDAMDDGQDRDRPVMLVLSAGPIDGFT